MTKNDLKEQENHHENGGKSGGEKATGRFARRRDEVIAAAIPILNLQGFKGMRLVEVAELIGLKATGITYYFRKKEDLALACIEDGLQVIHSLLEEAEKEPTTEARIRRLVQDYVERDAQVRRGEAVPLASFASIRALEGDHFERGAQAYKEMFRRARDLFDTDALSGLSRSSKSVRTLILLEQLYWANDWLGQYDLEQFPRLAERMANTMISGLAVEGAKFEPDAILVRAPEESSANENFMRAATREINLRGYRGASVDRISASLNLTKGAFYHHNEAKDELVAECFRRTFALIRETQLRVRGEGKSEWWRLSTVVTALVKFQLSKAGPLLRTSVLSSMPREHQVEIMELSYKASRAFASMISDAIADGSARAVDPSIASQLLGAGINAASDMNVWQRPLDSSYAGEYAKVLLHGLLVEN